MNSLFKLTADEANLIFADATIGAYSVLTGLKITNPAKADFLLMSLAKAFILLDLGVNATHEEVDKKARTLYKPLTVDAVAALRTQWKAELEAHFTQMGDQHAQP